MYYIESVQNNLFLDLSLHVRQCNSHQQCRQSPSKCQLLVAQKATCFAEWLGVKPVDVERGMDCGIEKMMSQELESAWKEGFF